LPATDPTAVAADAWARDARDAFLAGYGDAGGRAGDASGAGPEGALLRVLQIDKALYEVVYETRNRPGWVPIPLAALERLTGVTAAPL
jgi:predicted trehalose synthase